MDSDFRELLLLIHEHLQASGLAEAAGALLKEAQLTPLPSLAAPSSLSHQAAVQESPSIQIQWPCARSPCGFMSDKLKLTHRNELLGLKSDPVGSLKKKSFIASSGRCLQSKSAPSSEASPVLSTNKSNLTCKRSSATLGTPETPSLSVATSSGYVDIQYRTPIVLPMKRKLTDLKETSLVSPVKRLNTGEHALRSPVCATPGIFRRGYLPSDGTPISMPSSTLKDHGRSLPITATHEMDDNQCTGGQFTQVVPTSQYGLATEPQSSSTERLTLDSLVVQYLKHQHRQCPAPITTLPPLSLLHPHVCPEPRRSLDAPSNVTARLSTREFRFMYGGIHGSRRDRQFVYSRFRPWRTCRDDAGALFTCITFLGDSSRITVGGHSGELKVFDTNSNSLLDSSCTSHQYPLTLAQSYTSGDTQLLLSSSSHDVRLWDASSVSMGPKHSFEGCKAARFSNSGTNFVALSTDTSQREILLYDVQTCQLDLKLTDTSNNPSGRGHLYSLIHFSPSDTMLLWNGVLWDSRAGPLHRFDQFTDYGGGGFHPAGNEVIINSEVWDLRNFRLLRSVPSLDQTMITFNASGDVIYAILRRNLEDVTSAFQTRRVKHPLFSAFRTVDAVNYSDIATVPVDRCVLDFATEPTDSFVGLVTMDDQDEMYSSARVYEIGRRKPTDDDSDPDDAESEEDEDDDGEEDDILGPDLDEDGESDADDISNDDDDESVSELEDDDEEDGDFMMADGDFEGGGGILEIVTEGDEEDEDDSELVESFSSGDEEEML